MLTSDQLIELLQDPSKIGGHNEADLNLAAEKYPYCQGLQFLLAQHFRKHNEHLFQRQLGKTALLTNDRSVLFEFFEEGTEVKDQASKASESRDRDEILTGEWSVRSVEKSSAEVGLDEVPDHPSESAGTRAGEKVEKSNPAQEEGENTSSTSDQAAEEDKNTTATEQPAEISSAAAEKPEAPSHEQENPSEASSSDESSLENKGQKSPNQPVPGSIRRDRTARESAQELGKNSVNDRIQKILERNRQLRNQFRSSSEPTQDASSSSPPAETDAGDENTPLPPSSSPDQAPGQTPESSSSENAKQDYSSSQGAEKTGRDESFGGNQDAEVEHPEPGATAKENKQADDADRDSRQKLELSPSDAEDNSPSPSSAADDPKMDLASTGGEEEDSPPPQEKKTEPENPSLEEDAQLAQRDEDAVEDSSITTNELEAAPEERIQTEGEPGREVFSEPESSSSPSSRVESSQASESLEEDDLQDDDIEKRIETIRSQLAQLQDEENQDLKDPKEFLPLEGQIQEEEYSKYSSSFTTNELQIPPEEGSETEKVSPTQEAPPSLAEEPYPDPVGSQKKEENSADSLDEEFLEIEALVAQQQAENPPILVDEVESDLEKPSQEEPEKENTTAPKEPQTKASAETSSDQLPKEPEAFIASSQDAPRGERRSEEEEAEPHSFSYWLKKLTQKQDSSQEATAGANPDPKESKEPDSAPRESTETKDTQENSRPSAPDPADQEQEKAEPGKASPEKGEKGEQEGLPVEDKIQLLDSFVEKLPELKKKRPEEKPNPAPAPSTKSFPERAEEPAQISLVTETLAQVYIKQKHYKKAIQAYEILKLKYPEKSSSFARRIEEIKKLNNSK